MHIYSIIFYPNCWFSESRGRESPRQADGTWALKWRSICAFKDGECRGDHDTLMKAMNPREKLGNPSPNYGEKST